MVEAAAESLDIALSFYKIGLATGSLSEDQYFQFETNLAEAEDILDQLGVLDDHSYIQEVLEPATAEMVDVDELIDDSARAGEDDDSFEEDLYFEDDDIFDDEHE